VRESDQASKIEIGRCMCIFIYIYIYICSYLYVRMYLYPNMCIFTRGIDAAFTCSYICIYIYTLTMHLVSLSTTCGISQLSTFGDNTNQKIPTFAGYLFLSPFLPASNSSTD